jgi:WD40 repeat protein
MRTIRGWGGAVALLVGALLLAAPARAAPDEPLILKGHTQAIWGVAFSPDGKRLANTYASGLIMKVWDVETGKEVLQLKHQGGFLH